MASSSRSSANISPWKAWARLWQTIQLVRENLNPHLTIFGMVLTMFDVRTNLAAQVVKEVRSYFPDQTFATVVPRSIRLSEAPSYGQTVMVYSPGSPGSAGLCGARRRAAGSGKVASHTTRTKTMKLSQETTGAKHHDPAKSRPGARPRRADPLR